MKVLSPNQRAFLFKNSLIFLNSLILSHSLKFSINYFENALIKRVAMSLVLMKHSLVKQTTSYTMKMNHASLPCLPRVLRLRDAPQYLGMDINRFNKEVRPFITEVRIGLQGIGFDRLDLDQWFDQYKARSARSITMRN